VQETIRNQRLVLTGTEYVRFHGGRIDSSTLAVKSVQSAGPERTSVALVSGAASFAAGPVVPHSHLAASDSSGGILYRENVDYIIDYDTGTIAAKSGGVLTAGQTVVIWYYPFALYEAGADFSLNSDRGEIKRLATGAIADGETVWLDYEPVYLTVADEIIENAVAMANGMVESEVDPDRQFEVDPILGAAATYRALEIVCRAAASRELAAGGGGDKVALVWMKLADNHAGRADRLLNSFRPPYDGPRTPSRS
jgi:hypothetical protein